MPDEGEPWIDTEDLEGYVMGQPFALLPEREQDEITEALTAYLDATNQELTVAIPDFYNKILAKPENRSFVAQGLRHPLSYFGKQGGFFVFRHTTKDTPSS